MREILFRGKRVDTGEWVYGNLNYGTIEIESIKDNYCISDFDVNPWDKKFYPVIPETVGQYTGLNDQNGNKIFEGDIVHYYCSDVTALVKFGLYVDIDVNKEAYGFYSEYKESEIGGSSEKLVQEVIDHRESDEEYGCEVIGNIHDNPELLEVK